MKFLVDKCVDCGLDLTTAEPAEVTYFAETVSGACPGCGRSYIMLEVTPPPSPEPEVEAEMAVVEPEPERPTARSRRRRASSPERALE